VGWWNQKICLTPLCDDVDDREMCVVCDVDIVAGWVGFSSKDERDLPVQCQVSSLLLLHIETGMIEKIGIIHMYRRNVHRQYQGSR
jgi:hypothetical protein